MLPEKMQLVVIKQTAKQFHAVSHLMHRQDVTELIIATDAGREGELVARWIMQTAGWKGKTKRLWVSSQSRRFFTCCMAGPSVRTPTAPRCRDIS